MVDVRRGPLLVAPLLAGALVLSGSSVPLVAGQAVAAASTADRQLSAVLSITQHPGDRARLHQLAAHRATSAALAAVTPPTARRDAAVRWAQGRHLTVQRADAWTVTVTGGAHALARAFGTSVRTSSQGTWAPDPVVPRSLRGLVADVVGLDSRPFHHRHATLDGSDNPQTPSSLRAAYDLPATEGLAS